MIQEVKGAPGAVVEVVPGGGGESLSSGRAAAVAGPKAEATRRARARAFIATAAPRPMLAATAGHELSQEFEPSPCKRTAP